MGNAWGKLFRVTTWGESHGPAIGAVLDGVPAQLPLCAADIQHDLDRRRAVGKYATQRHETDRVSILSGIYDGSKVNTLVGVAGLLRFVNDVDLTNRLLDRAFSCMDDVCVCKLRRGIKISFYAA